MRHASCKWCITSSYSKTSVFVRPHVNEWPAFSKIFTLESVFEKMRNSVIVFTEYKWSVGEIRGKKCVFKQKRIVVWTVLFYRPPGLPYRTLRVLALELLTKLYPLLQEVVLQGFQQVFKVADIILKAPDAIFFWAEQGGLWVPKARAT